MKNEGEIPLGDPTARAFSSSKATKKEAPTPKQAESNRRSGDSGLGQPEPCPKAADIRILSASEQELLSSELDADLEQRFESKFAEFKHDGLKIPVALYKTARLILLLLSGILGLFLISEGITIYQNIQTLPEIWQYTILGLGAVFALLIISVSVHLFIQLFALQRSPQINLKALTILEERAELRALANKHATAAREELKEYLISYPLDNYPLLYSIGCKSDTLKKMETARTHLLNPAQPLAAQEWLTSFHERFQAPLDELAFQRVKRYASRVAIGTAASPVGLIDQLIVLYGSLAMIKDILTLYHLRPAFGQSLVMLSRAIMQAYLSGIIGQATEGGVETLSDSYEEWTGELLAGSLTSSLKSIFAKTAEAGLNGFLLWRLGKATISHVQLISSTTKKS